MSEHLNHLKKILDTNNYDLFKSKALEYKNQNLIETSEYLRLLAFSYVKQQNYIEAIPIYLQHLNSAKPSFDIFLNLAVCYGNIKKISDAKIYFEKSLNLKNDFEDTYIFYARILIKKNEINNARLVLENGLKKIKNCFKIYMELATIYMQESDYLDAIHLYNKILKQFPNNPEILNNLAFCFDEIGEGEYAKLNYKRAIELNKNFDEPVINLANLYRAEGKVNNAMDMYIECLKNKSLRSSIYRMISLIHKFKDEEDHLLSNFKLHENSEDFLNNKETQHELYFALSKAYEDLKNNKEFLKYLNLANNSKRESINEHFLKKSFELIKILKEVFSKDFVSNLKRPEYDTEVFFIVGMPRSGTTLVEQILTSHSKVSSGGELVFLPKIMKNLFFETDEKKFKDSLKNIIPNNLEDIAKMYLKKVSQIKKNKKFLTDKLPHNFLYIGLLKSIFKNCKIIHCRRDPLENCFSIYKNNFPYDGILFAYDQIELARYYSYYNDLMMHWDKLYPNEIHHIQYEKLINNQEEITKNLINYCDLDWEDNCLEYYKNKNSIKTLSTLQARNPIYTSSIKQSDQFKDFLKPMSDELEKLNII